MAVALQTAYGAPDPAVPRPDLLGSHMDAPRLRQFGRAIAERRDELFSGALGVFVLLVAISGALGSAEEGPSNG